MTNLPHFEKLDCPHLIDYANKHFQQTLQVKCIQKPRQLIYADVEDELLFYLNRNLRSQFPDMKVPEYFENTERRAAIGAHMTLAYDEELVGHSVAQLPESIQVRYTNILKVSLGTTFFIIEIDSKALETLRQSIGLTMPLKYKVHFVPPHMTFGFIPEAPSQS